MKGHMMHWLKDFDKEMEMKDGELVITIKGEEKELEKLKEGLEALQKLHEVMGDECCCGDHGDCCQE